jgi:hypothetical protein
MLVVSKNKEEIGSSAVGLIQDALVVAALPTATYQFLKFCTRIKGTDLHRSEVQQV